MKFLSFDCAYKSLGYTYCEINTSINNDINILANNIYNTLEKYKCETILDIFNSTDNITEVEKDISEILEIIEKIREILFKFVIEYKSCVVDILEGKNVKDTTEVERMKYFSKFLRSIGNIPADTCILIEFQTDHIGGRFGMQSIRSTNREVMFGLLMYYSGYEQLHIVDPKLKKDLHVDKKYLHSTLLAEYKEKYQKRTRKQTNYDVNKEHSRLNFDKLNTTFSYSQTFSGLNKSQQNDLSDSYMQIFGFMKQNNLVK